MKSLVIAAVFAAAALTSVASADPIVCNEPWYPPPHSPHLAPCHEREEGDGTKAQTSNGHGKGQPPGRPGSEAAPDPLTDGGCSFTAVSDLNPEAPAASMTGYLYGGPMAQNGTVTCTIKIGVPTHNGSYVHGASRSATGNNGTTVLSPGLVSYIAPSDLPVYLCDRFTDAGGVTYYWDGDANVWTTNSAVNCELAISTGTNDPFFDPIWDLVETTNDLAGILGKDTVDPFICPVYSSFQGNYAGVATINNQGDVYRLGELFWDCPPYEWI